MLAVLIAIGSMIYQRSTGPTYPKKINFEIGGNTYSDKLVRSHGGDDPCIVKILMPDNNVNAILLYHRYKAAEEYDTVVMERITEDGNSYLHAYLPTQPPAGKLQYFIELYNDNERISIPEKEVVVIRFKGDVPATALIPHVLLMIIAIILSTLAGILAIARNKYFRIYTLLTYLSILVGGMILGPIVQKYAFGSYWTGIPFGWDLTDNKTLFAFLFWNIALFTNLNKNKPRYIWVWLAAFVWLVIYAIPHSMFGSELDYESGKVIQGLILLLPFGYFKLCEKINSKFN